jgi:enterochelin esterase-like enzyme
MQQNSPADVLPTKKQAWKLRFFLGAGTQDQPYYADAQQFAQELDGLHIPYHLDVQQGYHSWKIWQTQMYNALLWLRWS